MLPVFKLGLGAILLSSVACVPGLFKVETIASDLNNGMTYTVGGVEWAGKIIVEFEPKIGGFSFGTSGQISVPPSSIQLLSFTSYGVDHYVHPRSHLGHTWGSWQNSAVGSNDIGAFSL